MLIFLEASGIDILDAVENGPYIPKIAGTDNSMIIKPRADWSDDDKKKVGFNAKAKNIITSALCAEEFFRVSNCKSAKEMWDILQETHEGTTDVKRARVNTLMHEYELFSMKKEESISDLQTRFTHIVNNLHALGKDVDNEQQIGKIMRCLTREWQPKITAIAESRDLAKMTTATLFGKLREHEMELQRLDESEMESRKKKGLSLKVQANQSKIESDSCSNESSSDNEEPEIGLLVKKFKKFLKKKDNKFRKPSSSKTSDNKQITCYECGKTGHIKSECYKLQNKNKAAKSKGKEPVTKTKKAYIAWNDNDESSASSDEEEANMCLMANSDSESEKEVCLTSTKHSWYLDSGCSKHMTGDKSKFLSLTLKEGGFVKYGDNNRGKIIGIGDIGNESTTVIKNVLYVEGLKHNLLSISQLCDKGFQVSFSSQSCIIEHKDDKNIKLIGDRINNIYMLDFNSVPSAVCCLLSNQDETWLWHKRIAL
ncbi:uncharacterized protein [Cicer arietinum]